MRSALISILFIAALFSSCSNAKTDSSQAETAKASTTSYMIQKVGVVYPQERSFSSNVSITGTAMPNQMVKVHAMESGFVQSIKKDIGDYVTKGSVVASLQNPELSSKLKEQEAHTKRATAAMVQQEAEKKKWIAVSASKKSILDRLESTYKKAPNIVLSSDVDNARADYETASANLLAADASIAAAIAEKEASQAMEEAVRTRINMLQVKAPFSGIISKRFVDNGAVILNGLASANSQPIVEIQNINTIRLRIQLPESDAANISVGSVVKVAFPEISDALMDAKISRSSNTLDPTSRTMQVEIDIANQSGKIKPGMYAKVQLNATNRKGKLSVPIAAKKLIDDIPHLLVVENNIVKAIPLSQGLEGREFLEILNSEVTEKTQIIVQGKNLVKAGQEVEAKVIK